MRLVRHERFRAPHFTVSWPTGEFGSIGLEGAVKLGYRNELAAAVDDVIDPLEYRKWIAAGLRSAPPPAPRTGQKRRCIDMW